jgi:hypothetical protein
MKMEARSRKFARFDYRHARPSRNAARSAASLGPSSGSFCIASKAAHTQTKKHAKKNAKNVNRATKMVLWGEDRLSGGAATSMI